MSKKAESTQIPKPSQELIELAEKAGATIVAYSPHRVDMFTRGLITLGELQGINKDAQYKMAKVGFDYMREGKLEPAQKVFEGLQALDPFDAYFHTCLGAISQELGDVERAELLYSRALEINPYSPVALAQRGEIRLSGGRLSEAIDDLSKALKEDPEGKEPATRRARVLLTMVRQTLDAARTDPVKTTRDARKALEEASNKGHTPTQPNPTHKAPPKAAPAPAKKAEPVKGAPPKAGPPAKKTEPVKGAPPKAGPPGKKPEPAKAAAKKPEPPKAAAGKKPDPKAAKKK